MKLPKFYFYLSTLLHLMQGRGRGNQHTTEMKRLEKDMESTFQRVVKIDPFDVSAYRPLASVELFGKYDSFEIKWLLLFILDYEIHLILIVWKLKTN